MLTAGRVEQDSPCLRFIGNGQGPACLPACNLPPLDSGVVDIELMAAFEKNPASCLFFYRAHSLVTDRFALGPAGSLERDNRK